MLERKNAREYIENTSYFAMLHIWESISGIPEIILNVIRCNFLQLRNSGNSGNWFRSVLIGIRTARDGIDKISKCYYHMDGVDKFTDYIL